MSFFETHDVVKRYANHLALNKVSISVPEGSVFGLLGPNGAGKTTLIRIINQITAPDSGEVLFNGRKLSPNDIYNIGYLPEERGLYKKMKVGEQDLYLAQLKGLSVTQAKKKLKYWFEKFEITAWWDKKVEELSKGMAQKIQFITTILHEPKLLIFDEPFSGFDPINANLLKEEIMNLRENGSTVIFSTHNMSSVEEVCDNIALINNSQVILNGEINEVKSRFRTHKYNLAYTGDNSDIESLIGDQCQVINKNVNNALKEVTFKIDKDYNSNELLKNILPIGNIVSFNEIIPSMNDIFIKVVEESKK